MKVTKSTKVMVIADPHVGAAHAVLTWIELITIIEYCKKNGILLILVGDIIDIVNVPEEELDLWKSRRDWLIKELGRFYVLGNHECKHPPYGYYLKIGNVLFCHSHTLSYSPKKIVECETKTGGKGKLGLKWYKFYKVRLRGAKKPSKYKKPSKKKQIKMVEVLDRHDCDTLVHGHNHQYCDEMIGDGTYRDVNSPRGVKVYTDLFTGEFDVAV